MRNCVWGIGSPGGSQGHYHLLIWLPRGMSLPKPDKRGWWPHGLTRIEWARSAVGYLAKYASKGTEGHAFTAEERPVRAPGGWLGLPDFRGLALLPLAARGSHLGLVPGTLRGYARTCNTGTLSHVWDSGGFGMSSWFQSTYFPEQREGPAELKRQQRQFQALPDQAAAMRPGIFLWKSASQEYHEENAAPATSEHSNTIRRNKTNGNFFSRC